MDLYKTRMCRNAGDCKYGNKCTFAHSQAELRTAGVSPQCTEPQYFTIDCIAPNGRMQFPEWIYAMYPNCPVNIVLPNQDVENGWRISWCGNDDPVEPTFESISITTTHSLNGYIKLVTVTPHLCTSVSVVFTVFEDDMAHLFVGNYTFDALSPEVIVANLENIATSLEQFAVSTSFIVGNGVSFDSTFTLEQRKRLLKSWGTITTLVNSSRL